MIRARNEKPDKFMPRSAATRQTCAPQIQIAAPYGLPGAGAGGVDVGVGADGAAGRLACCSAAKSFMICCIFGPISAIFGIITSIIFSCTCGCLATIDWPAGVE